MRWLREGHRPEFVGRRTGGDVALLGRLHIDRVDALAVGGVSEAEGELGVGFGLADALREFLVPRLRLDDRELGVAIDQHVVGDVGLAAPTVALDTTGGDARYSRRSLAALDYAPAGGL